MSHTQRINTFDLFVETLHSQQHNRRTPDFRDREMGMKIVSSVMQIRSVWRATFRISTSSAVCILDLRYMNGVPTIVSQHCQRHPERAPGPKGSASCNAMRSDVDQLVIYSCSCIAQHFLEVFGFEEWIFGKQRRLVRVACKQFKYPTAQ